MASCVVAVVAGVSVIVNVVVAIIFDQDY